MGDSVKVERGDGFVTLTLDRPDKLNALDLTLLETLIDEQERLRDDPLSKVVVLRGAGRAFCVGADLSFVQSIRNDRAQVARFLDRLHAAVNGLEELPQVVVGVAHGLVLAGGLELIMGSDVIVAARSCRLGDQHANFGLVPGGGGSQRLPRLVGLLRAKDLLFTGRWVDGDEAERIGLVSRSVEDENLDACVADLVAEICQHSATALAETKYLVNHGRDISLTEALWAEKLAVRHHFESPDFAIGLKAFETRGKPKFPPRGSN